MAADFEMLLATIETENETLKLAYGRLSRAIEKLDGNLTRLGARVRIDPYEIDKKSGLRIGYRRFEQTWRISTIMTGIAGMEAEVPVGETPPERQAALMPHLADLLERIGKAVADEVKNAKSAAETAEKLLIALG